MLNTNIIIKRKSDLTPALPDVKNPKSGELKTVVILEKGMSSGKTSLGLHIIDSDGNDILVETSVAIFEMINGAVKGAEIRWAENPE